MLIIAVGITCLVGILTAIDTILFSMSDNFNRLGANSFNIYPKSETIKSNRKGRRSARREPITYDEAMGFKDRYTYGSARVAVDIYCTNSAVLRYKDNKTNPTYRVVGVDDNYFYVTAFELEHGRNFSRTEVENGNNKVILGSDVVKKLFDGKGEKAVGEYINIGNGKFKVIGTLKQKGSSSGGSNDSRVFIPLLKGKMLYGTPRTNYSITSAVANSAEVNDAVSHAIGDMRNIRKLKASEDNNFEIRKSDGILEILKDITTELRLGTIAIALITLLGAAIGLMNIMLVSVTERTREIGVRKALGATRNNILIQFLTEAIVICQLGGLLGIIFGILLGFGLSIAIKGKFVIPWDWMTLGFMVCLIVGVISGLYPALKASRLDPIESLRYE
jgi:putative ABC transport system permease protein